MYEFSDEERRIYEALPLPVALFQYIDNKPVLLLVSDGFCKIKNIERGELFSIMSSNIFEFVHPDEGVKLLRTGEAFARHESNFDALYRTRIKGENEYHTFHTSGKWQIMPDGSEVAFVLFNDMTGGMHKVRRMTEEFEVFSREQFYTDHVTGLRNITYFQEHADEYADKMREDNKVPMLIYFDVTSMQSYNRQYGYMRGDDLLNLIGEVLAEAFKDEMVMRGNDDHFIVICNYIEKYNLPSLFDKINNKIKCNAYGNTTGVQAGISSMGSGMKADEALGRAKYALKEIMNNLNKAYGVYTYETDEKYWQQRYIIENFERALENGWIKIYYQCIMNIKTGNACALEALARWVDPERGIITPGTFIPVL